ncbi:phosphatase PAP2 family protein [[Acholeplasma] multilocale]|uniref:phosphatase PAP2 family protein n=1 Tax=[Acholeplasma] multilocale TaxID=264638 RepID=UPI000478C23D|nr:phosphatase PAP2 family protein [[Acholeplasma] multilocale]
MKKYKPHFWWASPLITLATIALIGFITVSFNGWDDKATMWMAKGMEYKFIKYFVIFYFDMGEQEIYPLLLTAVFIIIESFFAYKKTKTNSFIKRNENLIWLFYIVMMALWLLMKIMGLINIADQDMGWGEGVYVYYLSNLKDRQISRIILLVIESSILVGVIYYLRFKFSKKPNILSGEYWVDSIRVGLMILIPYVLVLTLEDATGRTYPVHAHFEDVVGKVTWVQDDAGAIFFDDQYWTATWIELTPEMLSISGIDKATLEQNVIDSINKREWGPWGYYEWYQVNGNFWSNLQYWKLFNIFTKSDISNSPLGWRSTDFPSGHTVSAFSLVGFMFFRFRRNKSTKFDWKIRTLYFVWLTNIIVMMSTLVIGRAHWVSDVLFSFVFCTLVFFFVNWFVERTIRLWICRFNHRYKNEGSKITYIFKNNKIIFYVNHYGFEWKVRTIKFSKNNIDKTILKINKNTIKYKADQSELKYIYKELKTRKAFCK